MEKSRTTQKVTPIVPPPARTVAPKPKINPTAKAKPNTVPLIPTDWSLLGLVGGYNPKLAEALRLYALGPYNEGKTTFIASIPNNIILDFEDGANAIVGPNSVRIHIRDYEHLVQVTKKLVEDAKNKNQHWKRVSFDTIEEFVDLIKHQLEVEKNVEDITDYGSRGHGYNLILQRVWSVVMDLEQAGYTWAIVGHQKIKTEMNPATKKEEAKIREAVYPGVAAKIKNKSDFQITVYRLPKTKVIKTQVKIATGQVITQEKEVTANVYYACSFTSDRGDAKSRGVPTMDAKFEIPLINGWNVFKEKYDNAVEAARKDYL